MLIKTSDTIQADDGRRWHVRDRYAYSRDSGGFDVVLLDEQGEPEQTVRVESLDELDKHLSRREETRARREPGPDRPHVVQLPPAGEPEQDWQSAVMNIRPAFDTVFVEMDPYRDDIGGVLLTDIHRGAFRPDSGVVVACNVEGEIVPGTHVVLEPYGGNEFDGFVAGSYEAKGRVKVFGAASTDPYIVEYEDWEDNIMGAIDHVEGAQFLRALGDWVLLRRDPEVFEEGGIALPDRQKYRSQKATVVSAGLQSGYREGQRVMYHGGGLLYGLAFDRGEYSLEGDPGDYVFTRAGNLYGLINEKP